MKQQPALNITLYHDGGDDIVWEDVKILIDGKEENDMGNPGDNGVFSVGNSEIIEKNLPGELEDLVDGQTYRVKVIWIPTNSILIDKAIPM